MKIRSFVALEFPISIQDAISQNIAYLRRQYPPPQIRWVNSGNIHLTLKFLGDLEFSDLNDLAGSIANAVCKIKSFSISFTNLGIFPNPKKPRILWIGVNTPTNLMEIQSKIELLALSHEIQKEQRAFTPHITLGRFSDRNTILNTDNLMLAISSINVSTINKVSFSTIKVFKSDLRPDGPTYTPIHNIPFGE